MLQIQCEHWNHFTQFILLGTKAGFLSWKIIMSKVISHCKPRYYHRRRLWEPVGNSWDPVRWTLALVFLLFILVWLLLICTHWLLSISISFRTTSLSLTLVVCVTIDLRQWLDYVIKVFNCERSRDCCLLSVTVDKHPNTY